MTDTLFVIVANATAIKLTNAVPTIEQSGMYVYVPCPVSDIYDNRLVSN